MIGWFRLNRAYRSNRSIDRYARVHSCTRAFIRRLDIVDDDVAPRDRRSRDGAREGPRDVTGRHVRVGERRGAPRATRTGETSPPSDGIEGLERRERRASASASATSHRMTDGKRSRVFLRGRSRWSRVGREPAATSATAKARARDARRRREPAAAADVARRRSSIAFVHREPEIPNETDESRARRPLRARRRRFHSSTTRGSARTRASARRRVLSSTAWPPARSSERNTSDTCHKTRISCFTSIARTRAR